uniref:SURP motif domain-containing protein n=1 Tax=Anopheles farauti TaxID=69004 RepID=A0A182Q9L5_9DIPT
MTERWNASNSVMRGALGSGTNTCSNGSVGNGTSISLGHHGGSGGGDGCGTGVGSGSHGGTGAATTTFSAANGESGILRRTSHYHQHGGTPENLDDLLVFGYSCKIFRNDERARYIDQGRHLIPWMGDNQLKIDRYDARGALHDLSPYEPPQGGYRDRLEGLTAAEQKAEQLCEEERYYSLYHNEVEEEMYQEEARKRELMLGNQIAFNYDAPNPRDGETTVATVEERSGTSADEQDDDPYTPPKGFEIPPDIPLPETMKEHAIIEKTAKFIASQDAQMEILLKTKQANNPLFEFLNQSGRLFRYYRHVLLAFRTNQYPIETEPVTEEQNGMAEGSESTMEQNEEDETQARPKIIVPAIKYKPSVDCAYTQLISKITGAPIPKIVSEAESTSDPRATSTAPGKSESDAGSASTSTPSVEVKKVSTGLAGLVQYDSDSDDDAADDDEEQKKKVKANPASETKSSSPPLGPFQGVVPAVAVQNVIDRTAIYVAKNGYSFEEALRAKNDARFVFLNQAHEYYPYYAYRVRQRMNGSEAVALSGTHDVPSPPPAKVRMETENGTVVETTPSLGIKAVHTAAPKVQPVPVTNIQHQKLGAPVSFSLMRKQKEDGGAVKTTVSGLGSDEEDEKQAKTETEQQEGNTKQSNVGGESSVNITDELKNGSKTAPAQKEHVTVNDLLVDGADVLEASTESITVVTQPADREPAVSKEKQAERKKRANLFVNLIKHVDRKPAGESVHENTENGTASGKLPVPAVSAPAALVVNDVEENGSIHSIHSTSVSPKEAKVSDTPPSSSNAVTTVIEDDDDDDVVLVSETRPSQKSSVRSRSYSRTDRASEAGNGAERGRRSTKKKKSKSRHRSARGKKKSKKKSRTRSRSPSSRSERSCSRRSRVRKRSRSTSSRSGSSCSRHSVEESKRNSHTKRSKRSKRTGTTRSRSVSQSRSRSRSRSRTHRSRSRSKAKKRARKRNESPERRSRKERSRSRTARRYSDSDAESHPRGHHRESRRRADDGQYEYDERYPPARARYWDC